MLRLAIACTIALTSASSTLHAQTGIRDLSPPPHATADPVVLSPGDALRITVWRKPELSGEFLVTANGTLADPFYMDVPVAGIPMTNVISQLRSYLAQYEVDPRVLVEPLFRISVGGEVRQPNIYKFGPETTVAQAVMLAGGPTEQAHLSRVRILRDGTEVEVDLRNPQSVAAQMPIRSGDQLLVGRRGSMIREWVAPASSILSAALSILYVVSRNY